MVRIGFRYGVEGSIRDLADPHIDEYAQHLLTELGDPPTRESAAKLALRLPVQIHLLGDEHWSSGGTLEIESAPGKDTRVVVQIPVPDDSFL